MALSSSLRRDGFEEWMCFAWANAVELAGDGALKDGCFQLEIGGMVPSRITPSDAVRHRLAWLGA